MDRLISRPWTCAILGGLVLLAVICAASTGLAVWLRLRPSLERAGTVDRIAYVGADGNIYVADGDGANRTALTDDAELPTRSGGRLYRFPTWSPGNLRVAFVGVEVAEGIAPTSTLYVVRSDGDQLTPLFSSQESGPFYLHWSPKGRQVAFLANEDEGLSLRLVDLDGEARLLDTGSPYYFTWSPDETSLITHVGGSGPGGRIDHLNTRDSSSRTLSERPAPFLAPAWSPSGGGVLYAAEVDEEGAALHWDDGRGGSRRVLVRYDGAISFGWSPQGDRIAYVITDQPRPAGLGQFALGQIHVIDRAGESSRNVSTEDAVAFFWAPNGRKIAYLTPVAGEPQIQGQLTPVSTARQEDQFRLGWRVVDLDSGRDRALTSFVPAPGFLSQIPFFDQYAQSVRLWSPDSTALVYSARGSRGSLEVRVIGVEDQSRSQRIANGDFAAWSWR